MTDTKKPSLSAIGSTGLRQYGGYIQEEFLTELSGARWARAIQEMSVDPTITGILFAIQMLIRQTPWSVVPFSDAQADKDAAAFVESCIHDMRESWAMTLAEILSFLPWGYAPMEVVYKVRGGEVHTPDDTPDSLRSSQYDDGKIGWACWSIRSQDTIQQWDFDADGAAVAFLQIAPPSYLPARVPLAKCLHFRTSSRKANPEGVSMLRGVYRPWYFKKRIENIEGIGVERDLAGLPVAKVPAALLSAERTAEEAAAYTAIKNIVTNIRRDEQEGVVWPGDRDEHGNALYELTLLSTGGARQFDTGKIVERYDSRIAMSVLADFILIGHQQVGSYSLVSSKTSLFATALGAWLDTICATINARIPELLRFNGLDPKQAPKLTHGDVEKLDMGQLGEFIKSLTAASAGQLFSGTAGERLWRYLLDQAGLPTPTDSEAQQAADQEEPPPPNPADQHTPAQAAESDPLDLLIDSVLDEAFALAGEAGRNE
jgi:hypothetical protein